MKAKKFLALVLALTLSLSLAACGDKSGDKDTKAPDHSGQIIENADGTTTLVAANKTDPGSYGPYGSGGQRLPYNNVLYETMVSVTIDKEIQNVLITGYEETSPGVYEIKLYDYIHDTEGNPVKASDVVFSFEKAIENGSYAQVLTSLDSITAKDDTTVVMTLKNERAGDLDTILSSINIISQAAWEASGDDMAHNSVGTSPYRMVEFEEGSYVLFEKTNDYWQTDESLIADRSQANVDYIRWVIINDMNAGAVALENGEVDHVMAMNTADYSLFMNKDLTAVGDYQVKVCDNNVFYGMVFNCNEASPCSDVNLRKAIATSIDMDAVVANVLTGYGRPAGNFVNPAYVDYDESMEHYDTYFPYDEAEAKRLVEAADYNGEPVKMLVSGNGNLIAASVLFEAYMKAAGINVEICQYENATYNSIRTTDSATEWDIMLINEQPASSASNLWGVMYFADESLYDFGNLQHFSDPKYQELYETMAAKDTHSTKSVQAFLDYTEENCYMYGLFVAYRCTFGSTNVLELAVDGTGNILCGGCKVKPE